MNKRTNENSTQPRWKTQIKKITYVILCATIPFVLQACGTKGDKGDKGQNAIYGSISGRVISCASQSLNISISNNTGHALLTSNWYAFGFLGGFISCQTGNRGNYVSSLPVSVKPTTVNGVELTTFDQTLKINIGMNKVVIPVENCRAQPQQCVITLTDNITGLTYSNVFNTNF